MWVIKSLEAAEALFISEVSLEAAEAPAARRARAPNFIFAGWLRDFRGGRTLTGN